MATRMNMTPDDEALMNLFKRVQDEEIGGYLSDNRLRALKAVVELEREVCAKIADEYRGNKRGNRPTADLVATEIADRIRARSNSNS